MMQTSFFWLTRFLAMVFGAACAPAVVTQAPPSVVETSTEESVEGTQDPPEGPLLEELPVAEEVPPAALAPLPAAPDEVVKTEGCPNKAGLCFHVTPMSAELVINGTEHGPVESMGRAGAAFVGLRPGIYQVTLRAEGYTTWRAEVSVRDAAETIRVSLSTPRRPQKTP